MSKPLLRVTTCVAIGATGICYLFWEAPPTTKAATSVEGVTGLPADITPLLSIAGVWQPVADRHIDQKTPSQNSGVAVTVAGNIVLPNGREGLVATGWSYSGFSNTATSITPVTMALLEQQADGTLQIATSKYVSDPQTNGGNNILVADFNRDGVADFYLPAHNESPALPTSSTAYLSDGKGAYSKLNIGDQVEAHGAALANINGNPTVFTASYYVTPAPNGHADTATQYRSGVFTTNQDIGTGGNSSVAVADFYGDGTNSLVCGDCKYGPNFRFDTTAPNYSGIVLWNLTGLVPAGNPFPVGTPYFNGKPQYASYPSQFAPAKTHNYRAWVDDFNHDGKLDIVVAESIWAASVGTSKTILQMFQNRGGYQFADVTDGLNPDYDQNSEAADYVPQVRDIDGSGVNSWLSGAASYQTAHPSANYVIVNDGSGAFHVALHGTLNSYGHQVAAWLAANPTLSASRYYVDPNLQPAIRAYRTPDGRLNLLAMASVTRNVNPSLPLWVNQIIFVNIPLRVDIASQFTQPLTIRDRNGSHLIRTFASDDIIYSGNNGGFSKVDGGAGTNTAIYAGPSQNYSAAHNSDGTWTIKDNVGNDGTDTLTRIQRLQFTDILVRLDAPAAVGPASSITATAGARQTATVKTAFQTAMQVTVRDFLGNTVPNVAVTFTAPATGAGGTFAGGAASAKAITNSAGIATAPVFTANGTAGAFQVTASAAGVTSAAIFSLTNTPPPGTITSVTVASGGADIAQNTWIVIKGTNLSPGNVPAAGVNWSNAPDFASGRMPTQFGDYPLTVTVNKKPAYLYFFCNAATGSDCSTDQINVLTPLDGTLGPVSVVVTNSGVSTAPFLVNMRPAAPAFPLVGATLYVVATHADYSLVGPASLSSPGYPFTPARPGETITLYGFGFGLPSTALIDGSSSQSGSLPSLPVVQIGGAPAMVTFAGVISPGLDQLNVVVPSGTKGGDNSLTCSYGGVTTPTGNLIAIQQ